MEKMGMKDPVFEKGVSRTAIASIPITPSGIACSAELYLSTNSDGSTKDATSGQISFISTGSPQQITFIIIMPSPILGQAYGVFLIILSGGVKIASYKATDDVIIPVVGTPTINWN